jgi:hypothetical protein
LTVRLCHSLAFYRPVQAMGNKYQSAATYSFSFE